MPELPEVETVARQLDPLIRGRRLRSVEILDSRLAGPDWSALSGRRILRSFRSGKQVALEFDGPRGRQSLYLTVHLRMTGRLIWVPSVKGKAAEAVARDAYRYKVPLSDKSLRARFRLEGGELRFYDHRRFGVIELHELLPEPPGLEPLGPGFTAARLAELLAGAKGEIKPWLLRQDRIAGIGNIYASEILFACAIDPRRAAGSLSAAEIKLLHRHTQRILKLAIKHCGTTFSDFQDTTGSTGGFQRFLKVYGREGEACPACGRPLERLVQQQRSSFHCLDCQR